MYITKREIVEAAFEELALGDAAGYDLLPEELGFGLRRLEGVAASLYYDSGVSVGYALAATPSAALLTDDSGLTRQYFRAYSILLAQDLAAAKGKALAPRTVAAAFQALDSLLASVSIPQVQQPAFLPVGGGQKPTPYGGAEYFTGSDQSSGSGASGDYALQADLDAEVARATAAEVALGDRIDGLTTDDVPESGAPVNLYHTAARVLAVVLTGFSTATNAAVTASDTVLGALGKLQAQINAISAGAQLGVANIFTKSQTSALVDLGTVTGTVTLDASAGNTQRLVLGGNITLANPNNAMSGQNLGIHLIQDGTGSRTITWGAAFKWAGGTAPTLTTTANGRDFLACTYDNVSSVWVCSLGVKGAA